jgi:hypothetical protein
VTTYGVQFQGVLVDGLLTPASVISYLGLPGTATLDQAVSAAGVWAAAIDGCVAGAFTQVAVYVTPPLPGGLKGATGTTWAASRVEQTGTFDFSATGTSRVYGQSLPSLSNAVVSAGKIDLSNPDVIAFVDLMLNPTGLFTNPQLQSLGVLLEAFISFRKRSQLFQSSMDLQ